MRFSRLSPSVPTALFALVWSMLMVLNGCKQEPRPALVQLSTAVQKTAHKTKTYDCADPNDIVVHVDPGMKNGVDQQVIYVCPGDKVLWLPAGNSVTSFQVQFSVDNCPFTSGCSVPITTSAEQTFDALPNAISVYKYSVSINGKQVSDPHVVGGGGY